MKTSKRMIAILSILATLLTALFLFACNGANAVVTESAIPVTVEETTSGSETAATAAEEAAKEQDDTVNADNTEKNADISDQNKQASNQNDQTTNENDQTALETERETTDKEEETISEEVEQKIEGEMGDGIADPEETTDETDLYGDDYARISWITADGAWDVCVHDRVVARAYFADGGILVISDFKEQRMEIWGRTDEYDHLVCYLYIQAFSGYREIAIREELGVIQIDLTTAELEALLPTPPLEEEIDIDKLIEESFGEDNDETIDDEGEETTDPDEEIVGGEESQEHQEGDDPSDELGEEEGNKPADETGDPDQDPPAEDDPIENDPTENNPTEDDPEQDPIADEKDQGEIDPKTDEPSDDPIEETGDPIEETGDPTPTPDENKENDEDPQDEDPKDEPQNDPQEGSDPIEDPKENDPADDPIEDPVEDDPADPEQNGDPTPDPEEEHSTPLCPICGAPLADTSSHFVLCEHYVILPMESEAYDLLSALPGMKEDISVAALDEESEIYSFVLNYLTYEEAAEIRAAITGERYYSDATIHVQKAIGSKVFTFDVNFCEDGDLCKATIYLRGFAIE